MCILSQQSTGNREMLNQTTDSPLDGVKGDPKDPAWGRRALSEAKAFSARDVRANQTGAVVNGLES